MPPPRRRGRPGRHHSRQTGPNVESPPTATDTASVHGQVADLAAWRQRRAWARAVLWLHDHGLPAAAPYDAGGWLRARGIEADWYYRAPCHPCNCGDAGCYVLAGDGETPPPEVHVCPRWTGAS